CSGLRALLRRHVLRSSHDEIRVRDVRFAAVIWLSNLGNPKVEHLRPFIAVVTHEHDVLALQIAMNYTLSVRRVQGSRHLTHYVDSALELQRTFRGNDLFQSAPVEVLHHEKNDAVLRLAKVRDDDRVRM